MNTKQRSYYKHVERGYVLRVDPPHSDKGVRRAMRFPALRSVYPPYHTSVTEQDLAEHFVRLKAVDVPRRLRG